MNRPAFYLILLFICMPVSCTMQERGRCSTAPEIRYMNLSAVYSYVFEKDRNALQLRQEKQALYKKIEKAGSDKTEQGQAGSLNILKDEMKRIRGREEEVKKAVYRRIDRAVRAVAAREGADFILNRGDAVIYAKGKYDVTELVIDELAGDKENLNKEAR